MCFARSVAGEPVNVVQALLGHASLSSTQIYIRAAGHHVREAAHALPVRGQLRALSSGGIGDADAEQWRDDRT